MTALSGPDSLSAPPATAGGRGVAEAPAANHSWSAAPERGTDGALRLMLWILRRLGWRAGHLLLYPIAGYFLLSSPRQRNHARAFLRRALGRKPGALDLFRLWFAFSSTILDRVFLTSGRTENYRIEVEGLDALKAVLAEGRGCLLLGAHFGSFEVLRAVADAGSPVELAVLMHEANARRVQALANAFGGPRHAAAVIPLGTTDAMLRAHECLRRGGMVGLLADRRPHSERMARVPFLGEPAPFPLGPHVLAGMLGAPVMLAFGVWRGPRRYLVRFEPFADPGSPNRANRDAAARERAAHYAARLEEVCQAHPYNWFNFHDFWEEAR
ncbi:MAG: lipid A biosynthesis acyltransferase [Acetobacteraceae bacterium]|nr:lipid A biosynthesis acyltransferase [Acetobacteraceae bacterium]